SERFLVVGPAGPVVVSPGEDAVLPCSLSPSISAVDLEIRWFRGDYNDHVCLYQNHMYVPQSTDSSYNGRADLFLQRITEGNVSLNLRSVIPSDDGPYKCMVVSSPYYEEAVINVRVTALGSQPSVSLHSPGGGQTQLLCRSEGWFPAPAVIWTDRDGHDVTSLSSTTVEKDSQGFLSVSSYIPVQQESNIFSCLVRGALPKPDWGSQLHIPNRDGHDVTSLSSTTVEKDSQGFLSVSSYIPVQQESNIFSCLVRGALPKPDWGSQLHIPTDVTLDPDTAHPELSLSEDGKRVRVGEEQDLPDNPERFDYTWCVLSREGLACGRHYWEVEGNEDWRIGVSRESAQRKGRFDFTPKGGYWGLECNSSPDSFQLSALTDPATDLPLSLRPRRLGVCVDIEERKVSFYIVESRTHIFTFTDMEFSQGEKIYPFLYTWDSDKDLVLLPPVHCGD
ncbi:BT1A1 protein, partial [Atractosteus spatula]|nr:BT1A1 protein [Atractosteus spatula]